MNKIEELQSELVQLRSQRPPQQPALSSQQLLNERSAQTDIIIWENERQSLKEKILDQAEQIEVYPPPICSLSLPIYLTVFRCSSQRLKNSEMFLHLQLHQDIALLLLQ
jgi:hypothetical protein